MSAACRGQREEVEQMKNCLRVLSQPMPPSAGEAELATDQQEREGALELLADLCENMDNAAGTPWSASQPPGSFCFCLLVSLLCLASSACPEVAQPLSFVLASSLTFWPPGFLPPSWL